MLKPFASSGTLTSKAKVADVLDKGSGCVILTEGIVMAFFCLYFDSPDKEYKRNCLSIPIKKNILKVKHPLGQVCSSLGLGFESH